MYSGGEPMSTLCKVVTGIIVVSLMILFSSIFSALMGWRSPYTIVYDKIFKKVEETTKTE
jgi:hypothetical protein